MNIYGDNMKKAFLDAIDEYNYFGVAKVMNRFRIDESSASFMYGFYAAGFLTLEVSYIEFHPVLLQKSSSHKHVMNLCHAARRAQVGMSKDSLAVLEKHFHIYKMDVAGFVDVSCVFRGLRPKLVHF